MILNIFAQVFGFIGSLCLLLFGMNMLSDGIQKGAGSNLQKLFGKIAGNRFTAVLTGIGVTAIIQSSGATTVMVVSFVNAEMLTLKQAIGVIFGANIGTTVTAWIVSLFGFSFSIADAAIPLFGIGFLLKRMKKFKIHNFADCFMGFAILFMGLDLLQKTLTLSSESAAVLQHLTNLGIGGLLLGVFIGAAVTALIHSSSAMTAIGMERGSVILLLLSEAFVLLISGCACGLGFCLLLEFIVKQFNFSFIPAFDMFLTNGYIVPMNSFCGAMLIFMVIIITTITAVLFSLRAAIRITPVQALTVTE